MSIQIGVLATALAMALLVSSFSGRSLSPDTLLGAAAHSALAVLGGIGASCRFDTPTAPTIVVEAASIFTLSHVVSTLRSAR